MASTVAEAQPKTAKKIIKKKVKKSSKKTKKAQPPLKAGVLRYGRAKKAIIKKILKPRIKKRPSGKKPVKYVVKPIGGEKNGKTRLVLVKKNPSQYPTETRKERSRPKKGPSRQYLKKSLTPGTVSIVLAGPHKGKRVVFLKQLESGLCLITGPFTLNRCPLRRINQIYLIGTSTKVDLGHDFEVPEHINDKYFRRVKLNKRKHKKDEADIFNVKPKKYIVSAVKKVDQKVVDVNVLKAMKKRKDRRSLCAYMSTKFSLKNHQFPHALKF